MMRKLNLITGPLIILLLFTINYCRAQETKHFWSLRGGYLYSIPVLTKSSLTVPVPLSAIGINPINSFYLGVCHTINWSRLGMRTEVNYQRKGMTGVDILMNPESRTNAYQYIGITSTISYNPFGELYAYLGPELNVLVAKESAFVNANTLEFGAAYRLGYRFKAVEITAGGMTGFIPYAYSLSAGKKILSYTNTNWQLGIVYNFHL